MTFFVLYKKKNFFFSRSCDGKKIGTGAVHWRERDTKKNMCIQKLFFKDTCRRWSTCIFSSRQLLFGIIWRWLWWLHLIDIFRSSSIHTYIIKIIWFLRIRKEKKNNSNTKRIKRSIEESIIRVKDIYKCIELDERSHSHIKYIHNDYLSLFSLSLKYIL